MALPGPTEALRNEVDKTVQNAKDQAAETTCDEFPPSSATEQGKDDLEMTRQNDPTVGQWCAEIQPRTYSREMPVLPTKITRTLNPYTLLQMVFASTLATKVIPGAAAIA
ncbi:putative tRNA (guanine(26)-N(2))-dimethyltransferase 1 [Dorcoceras hygrometricum]|uniref:Putative tRNA (Guanine(26)-N(2))-dimethyltransferase 1 n=1 Tax=Dorcoceras hygrometricum TaxID=472368 RepID=A0A2Z7D0M2_9LAMI|nr:putative tRNA (guanine(26)-N(2))-dimethyltransferase 1 [Dorcoceras hygrometricum]